MNGFFAWICLDDDFASDFRGGGRKDESSSHKPSSHPPRWLRTLIHKDIQPQFAISLLRPKPCISTKSWCLPLLPGTVSFSPFPPRSHTLDKSKPFLLPPGKSSCWDESYLEVMIPRAQRGQEAICPGSWFTLAITWVPRSHHVCSPHCRLSISVLINFS